MPRFTEDEKSGEEFFAKGEQLHVTVATKKNNGSYDFDLYTLNDKYELDKKLSTIKEACFGWQYDAKADAMYSVYEYDENGEGDHGLCSFDFKTSILKVMQKNANLDNVVLVK